MEPNFDQQDPQHQDHRMASASLALGVLSVCSFLFFLNVYLALVFASLGIMFALLSRGGQMRMTDKAIGGLVTSSVFLVLLLVLGVMSTYIVIRIFGLETAMDPEALQKALMDFMEKYMNATGGTAL